MERQVTQYTLGYSGSILTMIKCELLLSRSTDISDEYDCQSHSLDPFTWFVFVLWMWDIHFELFEFAEAIQLTNYEYRRVIIQALNINAFNSHLIAPVNWVWDILECISLGINYTSKEICPKTNVPDVENSWGGVVCRQAHSMERGACTGDSSAAKAKGLWDAKGLQSGHL